MVGSSAKFSRRSRQPLAGRDGLFVTPSRRLSRLHADRLGYARSRSSRIFGLGAALVRYRPGIQTCSRATDAIRRCAAPPRATAARSPARGCRFRVPDLRVTMPSTLTGSSGVSAGTVIASAAARRDFAVRLKPVRASKSVLCSRSTAAMSMPHSPDSFSTCSRSDARLKASGSNVSDPSRLSSIFCGLVNRANRPHSRRGL